MQGRADAQMGRGWGLGRDIARRTRVCSGSGRQGVGGCSQAVSRPPTFPPPQGSLLRGQLPLFLKGFFRSSEPVVVRVMGTVADALHRLGAHGAGAHSLTLALNARSFFDDVSVRGGHPSARLRGPFFPGGGGRSRWPPGGAAPCPSRGRPAPGPLPFAGLAGAPAPLRTRGTGRSGRGAWGWPGSERPRAL